jgi:DNA-directed RNA polymerase subunit beta'
LTKKNLRDIIGHVLNATSVPESSWITLKDMGDKFAFKGGLSFSLGDIRIPDQNHN